MPDILIDSNNVVEVAAVVNGLSGAPITTAAVKVSFFDNADDSAIVGEAWPVTLAHASGGTYRYTLSKSLTLVPCVTCRAEFSIDDGAGFHKEWDALYPAVYGSISAKIFIDNTDHVLTVDGLDDAISPGSYINGATVQITLTDLAGVNISGEIFPLALTYVAASNGKYQNTLRDTLDVAAGDVVKVLITADNGAGYHREWRSILTIETGA